MDIESKLPPMEVDSSPPETLGQAELIREPWHKRFVDSFKRDPNARVINPDAGGGYNLDAAAVNSAESPLHRSLKPRHIQMIAIGGSIGTGLFIGSGIVLSTGGPASLIISYGIIGVMMYCTVHALGELAIAFPVSGSFTIYSTRFIDPAWGFAMAWNYALQWLIVLPLEIVGASITVDYWDYPVSNAAWVTLFYCAIVTINFFGARGYGEAEFIFSIIKIAGVIGYIIFAVVVNCGGGPHHEYIGARYWYNPGAFNHGFKGLSSVFVNAAFAFAGTELVGLASAEAENPRKSLPTAIKQVFWRIALFYIISLLMIGLLIPYDNQQLLGKDGASGSKASPFVLSIQLAGVSGLPSVMNVIIMVAVCSVGNASVYAASRTLTALAEQGMAPKFLAYIDRQGRPLYSIIVTSVIGLLCYLAASAQEATVFTWMLALSGLSSLFTWGSICLCHIRFRHGWKVQGHSLDELAFRSQPGIIGSYVGFGLVWLVLIAQFWTGFAPVGYADMSASLRVQNFFESYLAAPVVAAFYLYYKIRYRTRLYIKAKNMDLTTGRRDVDVQHLIAEENAMRATWPMWKKVYKFFC